MLHAVNTQHGLQRIGPSAIARLGIKRLDDSGHILPWQNLLHAGEENLFSGLTALSAEFTIGEGELMAHDVPLGCAPDEYDDLISGTCSHLPFNFSPIVSSFVVSKREEYEKDFGRDFTERKCSQIISRASMLMVAVVMFFAFSCLFTLSPANMAEAKAQNIPVLSYLANHFASMTGTKTTFAITLEYAASIIALVAIFKSFFGHYLGTLEGLNGLILKFGYKGDKTKVSLGKLNTLSMIFIMGSTWVVAYANPNILDLIEAMGAPIIASLLCLLPMYAIRKAPSLAKYRGRLDNVFVTVIGLLTILNIVYKLF